MSDDKGMYLEEAPLGELFAVFTQKVMGEIKGKVLPNIKYDEGDDIVCPLTSLAADVSTIKVGYLILKNNDVIFQGTHTIKIEKETSRIQTL